jgi:hypothetical protein
MSRWPSTKAQQVLAALLRIAGQSSGSMEHPIAFFPIPVCLISYLHSTIVKK